jgi:hypothetical protein
VVVVQDVWDENDRKCFFWRVSTDQANIQRNIMVRGAEVKAGRICGMARSLRKEVRSGYQQESTAMVREKAEE